MILKLELLFIGIILFFMACENERDNSISLITFDQDELFIDGIGMNIKLNPIVRSVDGGILNDRELAWLSENEEVAIVDNSGYVTAQGIGSTFIHVKADNQEGKILIHVCDCVVDRFTYDSNNNIIDVDRKDTACNQMVLEYYENGVDYQAAIENNIIDIDSEGKIIRIYQKVCGFK